MKICPQCGYKDSPIWKPLFWKLYWEYASQEDFKSEHTIPNSTHRQYCKEGDFYYDFEDKHYYYKFSGKTRKMIHRFPKGWESMVNRKLFEKTPSEKSSDDIFQKKLKGYTDA